MTLLLLALNATAAEYRSVGEVLAHFENEPEVTEVHQMVLDYSKTDPRYVESWLKASQTTNVLPKLYVKYKHDDEFNQDFDYVDTDGDPVAVLTEGDTDDDHFVEAKAEWRLDKLVMSSERIRMISETQDIVKLRDKVLEEVTRVYFDRRRLQVEVLLAGDGDLKAKLKNELRLQELTAQLDAYTGGRFSKAIRK
ncbi:MAG: hypothetical protein ACOZNI_14800 [Myxococcota bacterium]